MGLFDRLRPVIDVALHGEGRTALGETPWSLAIATFEVRHGHDPRLSCVKAEACGNTCGVMAEARDHLINAMGPILDALEDIEENLNAATLYAEHEDHDEVCLRCLAEDAISKAWTALDRLDASSADSTGTL